MLGVNMVAPELNSLSRCRRGILCTVLSFAVTPLLGQLPSRLPPDFNNEPNPKPAHQKTASTKDVQDRLQKALNSKNAAYTGSNIQPAVDDQNITLNGTVTSEMQREMALQLARAYGQNRTIIDKLLIQQ
jgi:hypothetical protein